MCPTRLHFLHEMRWVYYTLGSLGGLVQVNVYEVRLQQTCKSSYWLGSSNDWTHVYVKMLTRTPDYGSCNRKCFSKPDQIVPESSHLFKRKVILGSEPRSEFIQILSFRRNYFQYLSRKDICSVSKLHLISDLSPLDLKRKTL